MAEIEGLDRLMAKLEKISKSSMDEALKKACLVVETEAKLRCPVLDGQLRQSITNEVDGETGVVGSNLEYAPYVHQGTGIYAKNGDGRKERWSYVDANGKGHSTIGQKPQPFLEQALDSKREDIVEMFKKKIEEGAK